jgi:hypothetical protein
MARPSFSLSDIIGNTPAPVQLEILKCKEFEIGTITGFAAGKTRGLCAAAISHGVRYPNAKILLGRKTYQEMVNTVKQPFFAMAEKLANAGWFTKPIKWDYREGTHHARLLNGSQFIFSNLDDPVKFRNEEYSMVGVDQAEELSEEIWEILIARIRWDRVPPEGWQAIAAANDNGHNWVWRRFVDIPSKLALSDYHCTKNQYCVFKEGHVDDDGKFRDIPCSTRRFFHGTTLDNQHNLSPRYLSVLLAHPPEWQRHFIYATMEGGSGRLLPEPKILQHFEPPAHWPKYRAIDHALNSPCCCLWIAINTDGQEYKGVAPNAPFVYREYWQSHSSVDQHAQRILDLSRRENILNTVIDKSTYQLTQSRTGGGRVSIADLYAEEGLYCSASVGDPFTRVERIIKCSHQGMVISDACPNLIRTMPEYYAEQGPTGEYKILNKSDFHAVDALGYGLMVIPIDSRDSELGEARPDYLRRSDVPEADKRHHLAEWKRIKRIQDAAESELQPAVGKFPFDEFGRDGIEPEHVQEYDPYGRW